MADLPPRGVPPKMSDERAFNALARKEYLFPFLEGALEAIRASGRVSVDSEMAALWGFVQWWKENRDPAFNEALVMSWAIGVSVRHAKAFEADIKKLGAAMPNPYYKPTITSTQDILDITVRNSVSLIKTIPERFHAALAAKLVAAERESLLDLHDRRKIFRQTGKLSGYILRRLTRDQANKLSGALNIHRLKEAGFHKYRWVTAGDERVRVDHKPRDGQLYDIYTGTGIANDMHPGEAVQCRCVAVAYTPPKTM